MQRSEAQFYIRFGCVIGEFIYHDFAVGGDITWISSTIYFLYRLRNFLGK